MISNKKLNEISKEIIDPCLDLSKDYAEIGLDSLLDENLLKEIPIIKTLVSIIKTGVAIKERFFIKKFLVFLKEFKTGNTNENTLEQFKNNFEKDEGFKNKITEQILIILEELDSVKKSKILAHLFSFYLKKEFDWQYFIVLSSCLKNLQEITYNFVEILSKKEFNFSINSGLKVSEVVKLLKEKDENSGWPSFWEMEGLFMASGISYRNGTLFQITKIGQDLYKYGISKILKDNSI